MNGQEERVIRRGAHHLPKFGSAARRLGLKAPEIPLAMGQISTPSERPNPTTKMGSKMGGEFTYQPKWDPIGVDPQPIAISRFQSFLGSVLPPNHNLEGNLEDISLCRTQSKS